MKMYILAFLAMFLFASVHTIAQKNKDKQESPDIKNWWWVQVSPLTIFEPEVPLSATIQYNPNPSWGIALDGGIFVARQSFDDNGFYKYSGVRFKPQVKYYFDIRKRKKIGFYISLQGLIKRTSRNREEWFSHSDANGQFLFNQLVNYKEKKLVLGGNFITGLDITPGIEKRWMIELYLGVGVRNKSFRADGLPADITIDYSQDNNNVHGGWINLFQNGAYPSFCAGFKIGYRFK